MLQRTSSGDGKRGSDVEQSLDLSPPILYFSYADWWRNDDRNSEGSADRLLELCAESRMKQRLCSMEMLEVYAG